jgi:hypothetical protein
MEDIKSEAHPRGGYRAVALANPTKSEFKNTDFVDIMISKVVRYLPFSRNQPLKLTRD